MVIMMTMCEGLELPKLMGNTVSMCSIFSHCFNQLAVLLEKYKNRPYPLKDIIEPHVVV